MIAQMSKNISSFFITQGIIQEDDREVYVYSFEVLLSASASFLTLIILAFLSHTVLETALYLLGFIPLRQIAGGYHAPNHFRCYITMLSVYALFLLLLFFVPVDLIFPALILCAILSTVLVFVFAPSEDSNKPLSSEECAYFRIKSRFFVIGYVVLIGLLATFIEDKTVAFALTLGVFSVALSLLVNQIRYQKATETSNTALCRGEGIDQ